MKKFLLIIGIVVILVVVGWLIISRAGQSQNSSSINITTQTQSENQLGKAPDFHLQDYNGKTVSLADFAGKSLVINTWASWCPFCRQELPDFVSVQKEFGGKVVIIAVDRGESKGIAKNYSDQLGVTNSLVFLLDPSDSFYQSVNGFSMPETIFVDKNGNIVEHKRGIMDINEMRQKIHLIVK